MKNYVISEEMRDALILALKCASSESDYSYELKSLRTLPVAEVPSVEELYDAYQGNFSQHPSGGIERIHAFLLTRLSKEMTP
jgi:hypothetical protein